MRKVLTDTFLKTLPAPARGRTEAADLRCSGLTFRKTDKGAASWCFRFRDPVTRKLQRFTIGSYPDVTLSQARAKGDELRRQVAAGDNPVTVKRQEREAAHTRTFDALADKFLARHVKRNGQKKKSLAVDRRNLALHVRPQWGKRRYDSITRRDVIELIEGMVDAGKPVQANRVHSLISTIFTFALDEDLISAHPCARLKKRGEEIPRKRDLNDAEIRLFWHGVAQSPVSRQIGLALRLALLTGLRVGEIASITMNEIHDPDDDAKAHMVIPGSRVKNGRDHLVPLSRLALDIVRELKGTSRYLLPSPVKENESIKSTSLTSAMERFGERLAGTDEAVKTWRANPPTPHDLRRTFATRLSMLGIPREDRDACMNHTRTDVGARYDRYDRLAEKRRALDKWSAALASILGSEPADAGRADQAQVAA
jgi:integrase